VLTTARKEATSEESASGYALMSLALPVLERARDDLETSHTHSIEQPP
jgi:hypothetical protein